MVDNTKAPEPAPPRHYSPAETILFVAATELMAKGILSPDTVELMCLLAPRCNHTINPVCDKHLHTRVDVSIVGAGSAFSGFDYVVSIDDAKADGALSQKVIDTKTMDIAQTAKNKIKLLWHQRKAEMAAHVRDAKLRGLFKS